MCIRDSYGVVGSGVVEVLTTHTDHIAKRAKEEIGIKYILDLREFPDSPFADKFTKSFDDIVNDPEVRVVVEVMGGLHPAFEYTMRCIEAGKSVVTSNKELVATKGAEILKLAQEKNVNFLFEASVGGGIPIIRPISQCLAANDVIEIAGILNGTTNFILTKMIHESMDFQDALSLAPVSSTHLFAAKAFVRNKIVLLGRKFGLQSKGPFRSPEN